MIMPERLKARPQWKGFPIPFATIIAEDGVPNFKVIDTGAWWICVEDKLCGACGQSLDYWVWYLGSAGHMEQGVFVDPPMHEECAKYAAYSCPYIAFGRAYGNTIRPVPGAKVFELIPRNELSNEGLPMFIARGRSKAIKYAQSKTTGDLGVVLAGTLFDVTPIERRKENE